MATDTARTTEVKATVLLHLTFRRLWSDKCNTHSTKQLLLKLHCITLVGHRAGKSSRKYCVPYGIRPYALDEFSSDAYGCGVTCLHDRNLKYYLTQQIIDYYLQLSLPTTKSCQKHTLLLSSCSVSYLAPLIGWQEGHPSCKTSRTSKPWRFFSRRTSTDLRPKLEWSLEK